MPKIRITNTTAFLKPPGFGLDYLGKYIPPNPTKPLIIEVPVVDDVLEMWQANRWCKIQDAEDKTPVTKETETQISPSLIDEAKASVVDTLSDNLDEDIMDFSSAKEAALTNVPESTGPVPMQAINQMPAEGELQTPAGTRVKAKVTLGERDKGGLASTVSPIPGDKPTSIDNSDAFTVRAPRQNGPGAVIKG